MLLSYLIIFLNLIHPSTEQLTTSKVTSALTQPFIHPIRGDVLLPGSIFTIRWEANTSFKNVTLQLWDKTSWGFARDLLSPCHPWARNPFCGTIAVSAPNTGSFDWLVPSPQNGSMGFGFPRGERAYWIKMYVDDYVHAEIGNTDPVLSYSQNFAFAKEGDVGTLATEQGGPTSTSGWDSGPPTVFVTVFDNGSATSTGGDGAVRDTGTRAATATSLGNKTALVPVEGVAGRVKWSMMGSLMGGLGLVLCWIYCECL